MFKPNSFSELHPTLSRFLPLATILFICVGLILSPTIGNFIIPNSQYFSTCIELQKYITDATTTYSGKILLSDCIEYLEYNPGSTRQEVMDHFKIHTWDDLLVEPIIAYNSH